MVMAAVPNCAVDGDSNQLCLLSSKGASVSFNGAATSSARRVTVNRSKTFASKYSTNPRLCFISQEQGSDFLRTDIDEQSKNIQCLLPWLRLTEKAEHAPKWSET